MLTGRLFFGIREVQHTESLGATPSIDTSVFEDVNNQTVHEVAACQTQVFKMTEIKSTQELRIYKN